jgi:hypothetical protein
MDDLVSSEVSVTTLVHHASAPGLEETYMYLVLSWPEPPPQKSVKFRPVDTWPHDVLERSVDFQ